MAIVKASYIRTPKAAKAAVRYLETRAGRDGTKVQRPLFTADGKVERQEVYAFIDQAPTDSYFYRLVVSPDPQHEDREKALALRELTEKTIRSLENQLQHPVQWAAAVHADHTDHRHIHALAILPQRLNVHDLQHLHHTATEAALEQARHQALRREAYEQSQEQGESLGWSW